jgi:hypothetical protein
MKIPPITVRVFKTTRSTTTVSSGGTTTTTETTTVATGEGDEALKVTEEAIDDAEKMARSLLDGFFSSVRSAIQSARGPR